MASLPTSLHPLVLHSSNKLISIRAKRINKENIAQRLHCLKVPRKTAREFVPNESPKKILPSV